MKEKCQEDKTVAVGDDGDDMDELFGIHCFEVDDLFDSCDCRSMKKCPNLSSRNTKHLQDNRNTCQSFAVGEITLQM